MSASNLIPWEWKSSLRDDSRDDYLDAAQTVLTGFGMLPVVGTAFNVVNAGISYARGDYIGAVTNLASAIPIAGIAAGAVKLSRISLAAAKSGYKIAGNAGNKIVNSVAKLSSSNKSVRQITVIGRYEAGKPSSYEQVAKSMNANYFSVPQETYESLGRGKVWQMNKKFLTDAMERGDRIVLSHKVSRNEFTGFGREILHLKKSGYKEIYTKSGRKIKL